MSGFTKLDNKILTSSIWNEPAETRVLWVTLLAASDENGFVSCSRSGLLRLSNISETAFSTGLECLLSPDNDSRTSEYDGRRIEKIEGGYLILNYDKYRTSEIIKREQARERVKRHRERKKKCNVTVTHSNECNVTPALPSASVSASASVSSLPLSNILKKEKKYKKEKFDIPDISMVQEYCSERKNGIDASHFIDFYTSKNWMIGKNKMKDWKAAVRTWERRPNNNAKNFEDTKQRLERLEREGKI
jgi:hypothetical protein